MNTITTKTTALDAVRDRTSHAEKIRALAEEAVSQANKDRARAIKHAMTLAPTQDVALAAGVSTARLYQLIKAI